jgi:Tol biopolymer transport system component
MSLRVVVLVLLIGLTLTASGSVATSAPKPPRGDRIVFESYRTGSVRLYTMAPDGSDVRPMPGGAQAELPRWSPDGTKVVFTTCSRTVADCDLYSMNIDGTGRTRVTNSPEIESAAAWSPAGTRLAFVRGSGIYVVNADGSGVAYLHDGFSPSWSPNGRRIVFELAGDLYTMNSDGSGVAPLTSSSEQEYSPAWSPDGTEIAFVRDIPGPSWHHLVIMAMTLEGHERLLAAAQPPSGNGLPRWSPDGSHVIFTSTRNGNEDIYTVRRSGTYEKRLTAHPALDRDADWGRTPVCLVPHVIGLPLPAAQRRIRSRGCAVGSIRRRRLGRVGRVVAQSPAPRSQRPPGSKVNLVVGRR